MKEQIKSKERVSKHGEVFTNEREVNAMLDLVKDETERIESRFLEPACGDGNFLAAVLSRKLDTVKKQYRRNKSDYEKYSVLAVSSLYGVDIMEDNIQECRERLYTQWNKEYTSICKNEAYDSCREAVRYILSHNILCGDALTMLQNNGEPIVFAQWDLVIGSKIKRRDYRLDQLMKQNDENPVYAQITTATLDGSLEYDEKENGWVAAPLKEYDLVNYWEVQYATEA